MDRTRVNYLRLIVGSLALTAVSLFSGCQTVRTPEDRIAKSNIPREFNKVSMPEYVVEPRIYSLSKCLKHSPADRFKVNVWLDPTERLRLASMAKFT